MSDPHDSQAGQRVFHTTRWTRVMAARGDSDTSRGALSDLCAIYHAPVRAFIGYSWPSEDVDDLTQAFFARLLERSGLENVDRERGRFRSYLLGAVKHFIRDHRARAQAEKRGGKAPKVELEDAGADSNLSTPPPSDALFDRDWALALIARALSAVEGEAASAQHFEILKPWLNGESCDRSQTEAAAELGISEGAVKVAIHRLRKRFRQCVRNEIAETVATEEEVGAELNYLIEVLTTAEK